MRDRRLSSSQRNIRTDLIRSGRTRGLAALAGMEVQGRELAYL